MYLLSAFRLSTYLTLLIACLALGYSEIGLLPEIPLVMAFSALLMLVGFVMEGRWALSLGAANIMGGVLTAIFGVWVAYQFVRPPIGIAEQIPFPVRLLPYLGPALMILIPAKLLRPKLHYDYWVMQGTGLLAVALGSAMAHDSGFAFLMVIYLFAFVWSMTLFYLGRCAGVIETHAGKQLPLRNSHRWLLFRTTGRWSLVIVGISVPLFLITPRPADNRWELPYVSRGRMETGVPTNEIDLNRTGSVENNDEITFEVHAEDRSGHAKIDLDPNQMWRVTALHLYERGRWVRDRNAGLKLLDSEFCSVGLLPVSAANEPLSKHFLNLDLGPDQYYLAFSSQRSSIESKPLSAPVYWKPRQPAPIVVLEGTRATQYKDGSFEWQLTRKMRQGEISYMQTTVPSYNAANLKLSQVQHFEHNGFIGPLTRLPDLKRLSAWTSELLDRLVAEGKLSRSARTEVNNITNLPLPKYHAEIAKALEDYLTFSKDFRYSLQLQRQDRALDPVEDFLFNVKSGHCQRFATSLALMLRTQGIPTRFVLGYKGFETQGHGNYIIRQSQAHAWVEALVPDPSAAGKQGLAYCWLTLDPTPGAEDPGDGETTVAGWFENSMHHWSDWFRQFVLGYNDRLRGQTFEAILDSLIQGGADFLEGNIIWPWYVLVGIVGLIAIRRGRRFHKLQRSTTRTWIPFQRRLLAILAKIGLKPVSGQTPREFAAAVASQLSMHPETRTAASIPEYATELYYRVCYGGIPLDATEQMQIDQRLDELESALSKVAV